MSIETGIARLEKVQRQISQVKAFLVRYPDWAIGHDTLRKLEEEQSRLEAKLQ